MNNPLLNVSLKWGGISAAISCLSIVATYSFGIPTSQTVNVVLGVLSFVVSILLLVFSNLEYRNTYLGGYIGYWQCFQNSFLVFLISGLAVSLFFYILYGVVDLAAFNEMIEKQLSDLNSKPDSSFKAQQIKTLIESTPLKQAFMQLIGSSVLGIILGLIVSAFTKKNKNNPFEGVIKDIE